MTAKTIGVVIPYFQRKPGLLGRAVRSVLDQDGTRATSVIIVDDDSPVPARAELAALPEAAHGSVRVIEQKNAGVSAARNRALDAMPDDTELIAFLDSDDAWHPGHLANACAALSQGYDFYFADHRREGASETRFSECGLTGGAGTRLPEGRNLYRYDRDLFADLFRKSPVGTPTVVFRRAIDPGLRFDERLSANEDTLFWLSLVHRGMRAAFCADEEVSCGRGVNIYASPEWGSPKILPLLAGIADFHRMVPDLLPISPELAAWNTAWRTELRRSFAASLVHLLRRTGGKSIDWRVVWHYLRAEPILARDIALVPAIAALKKISGPSRTRAGS
jgi:succinoglycan biosynthesis protein ExoW